MANGGAGRCGPLCQHPGCWHSSEPHKNLHPAKAYMRYVTDIISKHSKRTQQETCKSNEASQPALTVQSLDYALPVKGTVEHRRRITFPIGNGNSMQVLTAGHTLPKVSFSEMILTADSGESGGPSECVVTPVLVWRPGTKQRQRGIQGASKADTVKVMNLTDQVHLEEPEQQKSSSSVKSKVLRRRSRTARSSDDNDNYSYLQDIPPHIIQQLLEHLRSASSASLDNREWGCGILSTTPSSHPQTSLPRPHAHATHPSTGLPPLTPQPNHPSPRPVDTIQSPLVPDHGAGQPTPPPASIMYDLLTQMLWTAGAYHCSPSGYSRTLAERPHEVLKGYGRPLRRPAPSGFVATTTLTLPQRTAVHQIGSSAPSAQHRYPYGNPVLPRLPSRQYSNGESGPLTMEPWTGHKGQQLKADDLLHVSSYPSTPREPRVDPASREAGAGPSSSPRALDTIRIPGCLHPNTPIGPRPEVPGAKSDGVPDGGMVFSPDHTVVGAQLESGQLLLLDQHGEVAYQLPSSEPKTEAELTLPDIQQTLAPVTSDNQQTHRTADTEVDIEQTSMTSDNQQTLSKTDAVTLTSENTQMTSVTTDNKHRLGSPVTLALT